MSRAYDVHADGVAHGKPRRTASRMLVPGVNGSAPAGSAPARATVPREGAGPAAVYIAEVFKVTSGRIVQIDHIGLMVAAAIPLPAGVDPSRERGAQFALAPDGRRLAFVARDAADRAALWVRPLDSLTMRPVEGTDGASRPFWSPDGAALGFSAGGQLQIIDVRRGGAARALCPVTRPSGGAWTSGGAIVYGPDFLGPLYTVTLAQGGTPGGGVPVCRPLTRVRPGEFGHRAPSVLPDGRHVVFSAEPGAVALPALARPRHAGAQARRAPGRRARRRRPGGEPESRPRRPPVGEDDGKGGPTGFDAGNKVKGRKRHVVVATLGRLLAVGVHSAGIQDRDGARLVLRQVRRGCPRLVGVRADAGSTGPEERRRSVSTFFRHSGLHVEQPE